jgi:hypothetical protein
MTPCSFASTARRLVEMEKQIATVDFGGRR